MDAAPRRVVEKRGRGCEETRLGAASMGLMCCGCVWGKGWVLLQGGLRSRSALFYATKCAAIGVHDMTALLQATNSVVRVLVACIPHR